jgi:mono/diheme cytochrome c family protein
MRKLWILLGVLSCAAAPASEPSSAKATSPAASGRALFLANCATCHLGQGGLIIGLGGPPELLWAELPRGDSEEALTYSTANGTGAPGMPAFAEGLSSAEIAEIVLYIREERAARR